MKKIFTLVVLLQVMITTLNAAMVLAFQMQTSKASGSIIYLGFVAGGSQTVGVDWGDGNITTYTGISNSIASPTTITGTTIVNQAIIKVYVDGSSITNLVCVGANSSQWNNFTSLDLSRANGLVRLTVSGNNLTTLDVSNHTLLQQLLSIGGNNTCFRGINLSANTALTTLTIRNGGLKYAKDLDFSNCPNLNTLSIQNDGTANANTLNACAMDSIYAKLADRTGKTVGTIFVGNSGYVNALDNDYNGSDKTIAILKNWTVKTTTNNAVLTGGGGGCNLASSVTTVKSGVTLAISENTIVNNLVLDAGGTLTIATGKTLSLNPGRQLTNNGTITNNGTLKLLSDATNGTATLLGTVTGNAEVQQYLSAERNWYTASPITAGTAAALSLGTSVQTYSESAKGWSILNSGDALVAGKGYVSVATTGTGTTGTVSFNGTLNTGTITVPVTRTESGSSRGFNLVANPYPSYLDWSLVTADADNANIGSTMWFRTKNTLGAYTFATHNGTSGETVTGTANTTITKFIPPLQAFWIRVNANLNTGDVNYPNNVTSITFKNSMRAHRDDNGNKLKAPKQDERKRLRLQVSNGAIADEALVYFDAHAQDGFDNYDSPKMFNNAASIPEIYTQAGTEKLVINGMNELKYDTEIPLGFATAQANDFSISASEMTNFEAGTRVILIDKQNPTFETELTIGAVYNFSAPVTTASTNRFSLIFRAPGNTTGISNAEKLNIQVFVNAANQIVISAPEKCSYAIYNVVGKLLDNGFVNTKHETIKTKLAAGVYVVKVNNHSTRVVVKK